MIIKILGADEGCAPCKLLTKNVKATLTEYKIKAEVLKITDINEIIDYNVMLTPALVVDEELISSGKVLTVSEIYDILK